MDDTFAAPRNVAQIMARFDRPWCIAGGWSVDLFVGHETRTHADVEIAVLFQDQVALREHLSEWTWGKVETPGVIDPWPEGETLRLPVHEAYATSPGGNTLEVLFNPSDADHWVFRRDPSVRRPLANWIRAGAAGIPALAPEIALLYKAKDPRDKDHADFRTASPKLGAESRRWLQDAIRRVHPACGWAERL